MNIRIGKTQIIIRLKARVSMLIILIWSQTKKFKKIMVRTVRKSSGVEILLSEKKSKSKFMCLLKVVLRLPNSPISELKKTL